MSAFLQFFRGRLWLWELSALAWLLLLPYILTAHGHLDWSGHALGRDFVNYWSAGQLVREHNIAPIFTREGFLAEEHRLFDPDLPWHFWSYPPVMLFVVAPLGYLPYIPGLIVWSAVGLMALIPAARRFLQNPREAMLLVVCPAAAINVGLGQNGALTAVILLVGLSLWERRPILAGAVLGLLILKPQLALMLPIAVLAERRWTTMLAAGAVAAGLLLLSVPAFGIGAWQGFLGDSLVTQRLMLTQGSGPFQWMMPTVLMSGRLLGFPTTLAMTVQAIAAVAAVWATWRGWRSGALSDEVDTGSSQESAQQKSPRAARRSGADFEARACLLMIATFVASPQAFNYDLIPAACAGLVLWRRDQTATGQGVALLLWGLPILMISLQAMDAIEPRTEALARFSMMLAPGVLAAALWRFYRLCLPESPSRAAKDSTTGELASNT